jgi:hypothetical protein
VWFLKKARLLNTGRLTPAVLTTLMLLVAESESREKEKVIDLAVTLLAGQDRSSK